MTFFKLTFSICILFLVSLISTGCDDKFQMSKLLPPKDPLTIAEMIATGKEEMASECKKGDVSFNCEFLTGDLTGNGKWHHTKLYLYNGGRVDMVVDGKAYYQSDIRSNNFAGQETTSFTMKGVDGDHGEVNIVRSNEGKSLNFEAYDKGGKRFVMGGIKLQ
ncbi:hypothetical protein ABK660_06325 [Klebsiella pneumoniae]|uniref:hypothetical protein n=1 Tax=Klebsiella pneumoniae complex TaxID=3390273 RepID=UPI001034FAE6|nr:MULTISPECIES: hypothetical protein [Klebsiella]HCI6217048.1 hypothetical protein [Klebsiella quasipneumoniae subsp. quasipneumoniae]MCU8627572.1 hypothetical protein [Klebsiella pneumoniae]MCU8703637.1 hypothetical protein [Klebsiella pneumoniae]MCU8757004.1 hypothetical protein [Klebsiella pneumoniae]MDE4644450.1 hypothetical protein [Klebsiella quasipneumoniae subsp. similipneumoniae]